jgi:hypothetical protein
MDLLVEAENDNVRLQLCTDLPEWFRVAFIEQLEDLAETDFYRRSFGIGDTRTEEQVHRDALRQQELLRRLAAKIIELLNTDMSRSGNPESANNPMNPSGGSGVF